jgi:hypothetical protein
MGILLTLENLTPLEPAGIIVRTLAAGCEEAWNQHHSATSETSITPDERMFKYYYGQLGNVFPNKAILDQTSASPAEIRSREKHAVPCEP